MVCAAMGIPDRAPASFFAGDTVTFTVSAPDYLPADGWVAKLNLTNSTGTHAITGTDNGDGLHLLTIDAATSAAITAGDFRMVVAVEKGTERFTVTTGSVTVRPNLTSAADGRSSVKKALDKIDAWMAGDRTFEVAEYQIAGRAMKYWEPEKLIAFRSKLIQLFRNEQNADRLASGQRPRRRLLTRMAG